VLTPSNRHVCEAVWAIAKRELRSSREALDRLCEPDDRPSGMVLG